MVRVAQMGLARAGRGGRRRRCADIVDDERQRDAPQPPSAPRVPAAVVPSTAWALLDNERALPASRHLVSGPTALVTRPCPLLGQAPSPVLCVSAVGMATTETQSATN